VSDKVRVAMEREFRKAKYHRLFFLAAQLLIFSLSLRFAMTKGTGVPYFGILVLFFSALSLYFKSAQQRYYGCGERYRRTLFFTKNHNTTVSPRLAAEIGEKIAVGSNGPLNRESDYYASAAEPVLQRMLENLQESSYYTHRLADTTKVVLQLVSLVGLGVTIVFMLVTLNSVESLADPSALKTVAEISARLLAFFVVGQYVELWFSFASLQKTSEDIYRQCCDALSVGGSDEKSITQLVSTYDCSLATASPIPTWIWQLRQRKLNRGWDEIKASRSSV
jgi:hypothetical protein